MYYMLYIFLLIVLQSLAQESKEMNTTVDAVQKTVYQTQRDVQGIKDILESCKYKQVGK